MLVESKIRLIALIGLTMPLVHLVSAIGNRLLPLHFDLITIQFGSLIGCLIIAPLYFLGAFITLIKGHKRSGLLLAFYGCLTLTVIISGYYIYKITA